VVKDASKTLFALGGIDKEVHELSGQKVEIEAKNESFSARITAYRAKLEELQALHEESSSRQAIEETRLREEEAKIVERRKQLTTLGGAKSAKLIERELDIATRAMETMERSAMEALEIAERVFQERENLNERLKELEGEFSSDSEDGKGKVTTFTKQIDSLNKKRDNLLGKVDERLKNLYNKVNMRYPGDGISIVKAGACRSCFRSLPAQMYNQVIAGNMLLQCPGCSRILIYGGDSAGGSSGGSSGAPEARA